MKKISVIIPVYKTEKVLEKCVGSVISQTYKNLEIILIDDGSPDESGKICDDLKQRDARIKVIHKENGGVSSARNCGLNVITGDYCTFVDSDDYIESCMYQEMMQVAEKYDCDVVMCDCVKENDSQVQIYTHNIRSGYYTKEQIEQEYFPHLLMMPNVEYPPTISNCLCLFKVKENSIRYEEGIRFSEDLLFGAELIYNADSFYYMKGKCFYHYWMNPNSATHTFVMDKWDDYLKLYAKIKEKFGDSMKFDFSHQIDLTLLFFVYNAVGDIISSDILDKKEKKKICFGILKMDEVRKMFNRLSIWKMPITNKLKLLTIIYKYMIGVKILIARGR